MAERPKRPLSAYMLWLNDNRESIKREHPGIKVTEVAKRGGELWRGLKDKSVSIFTSIHPEKKKRKKHKTPASSSPIWCSQNSVCHTIFSRVILASILKRVCVCHIY